MGGTMPCVAPLELVEDLLLGTLGVDQSGFGLSVERNEVFAGRR